MNLYSSIWRELKNQKQCRSHDYLASRRYINLAKEEAKRGGKMSVIIERHKNSSEYKINENYIL